MQLPYDDRLAQLIAKDSASIEEVAQTLAAVDAILDGTRDGLKWFNTLYLEVTLAVLQRVQQNGFSSPEGTEFISKLDFVFANFYLGALRSWLRDGSLPDSWRIMFAQRTNAKLARIQFALAGVNAHINRDLAIAVVSTSSQLTSSQYNAYTALNTTLDSLIQKAERELMITLPGDALPSVNAVQQMVAAWSVAAARESAWVHAEILSTINGNSVLTQRFVDSLDGTAALAGKALLI